MRHRGERVVRAVDFVDLMSFEHGKEALRRFLQSHRIFKHSFITIR